jgi:hypothetical protein
MASSISATAAWYLMNAGSASEKKTFSCRFYR